MPPGSFVLTTVPSMVLRLGLRFNVKNITFSTVPTNIFWLCRVGLPMGRGGIVEAKEAAYSQFSALHWAAGSNKETRHRGSQPPLATQWHPYKHSTNRPQRSPEASHPMEESHTSATGWHRGGLQGGPLEGLWRLISEPTLLYPDSLLCLLTFCFTGGLQQLT